MTPLLLVGAGHMGGALIEGWIAGGAIAPIDLMIRDPNPGDVARKVGGSGATLNPPDAALAGARTVVLALKPQVWREGVRALAPHLAPETLVVSIMAGVTLADLAATFGDRPLARVMPNIAASIGQGVAAVYAATPGARALAQALFAPIATVVDLADEDLMHLATAVGGSGPAYLYAFTEALAAAAEAEGLESEAAASLARATVIGAAALMAQSSQTPGALRRQVTSPGGTTEAALSILTGGQGLGPLLARAVRLASERSRALGR